MKKISLIFILFIIVVSGCMKNPTPDEIGLDFEVSTDKLFYKPGDLVTITFHNNGEMPIRIIEHLIKEGTSISYDRAPLFIVKAKAEDGSWRIVNAFESNYGSQFPYHIRGHDTYSWKSTMLSKKFRGNTLKVVIAYKDGATNTHTFSAESAPFEIAP